MRHGITKTQLQEAGKKVPLREGAKKLMELFEIHERLIVSWGIKPLIESCMSHHEIETGVAATILAYDEQERINRVHPGAVVVGQNKHLAVEAFLELGDLGGEHVLAVGDSSWDLMMMPKGGTNVLLVSKYGSDESRIVKDRYLDLMWNKLTLIVQSASLMPLVELIEESRKI
jgi:phosphoserine phosphatase